MATTELELRPNGAVEGTLVDPDEYAEQEARARDQHHQLSFNVGLPGNRPDFGAIKVSGALPVEQDLKRRQEVVITVATRDGEVLCSTIGTVVAVAFKDKTGDLGTTTERIHTVSL